MFVDKEKNIGQLANARVTVLGAARSGVALAKLLAAAGAKVLLSDQKSAADFQGSLERLPAMGIKTEFGEHSQDVLDSDLICISPGIPLTIPILKIARHQRIPVLAELEVASWFCKAPIIAITGSNGKTTTTSLAAEVLSRKNSNILVGGNIGVPMAARIQEMPDAQLALLEVSSFQLEAIEAFHPGIAVITNLSPNHLDRYTDYDAYIKAKLNILKNMEMTDILIYNADDSLLSELVAPMEIQKIPFSNTKTLKEGGFWKNDVIHILWKQHHYQISVKHTHLRGPHNHYNMIVAALLGVLHNVEGESIADVLQHFPGIEHRLEAVEMIDSIQFVNDSKATTVTSLGYALQSFQNPIVLIAGGIDKGGDFAELNPLLTQFVRAAIVIGKAARMIKKAWQDFLPVYMADSLADAVTKSFDIAQKGDVVLLSPACSSFDMFQDYEERGRQFKKIVRKLKNNNDLATKPQKIKKQICDSSAE